jgi:hypothetical protein
MTAVSSTDFYRALRDIVVLPANVKELDLRLRIDELAEMRLTLFPELRGTVDQVYAGPRPKDIVKRFHLVEITGDQK